MTLYYLGIDVSKGYADFLLVNQKKEPADRPFQLDDTASGHDRLLAYLNQFILRHGDAEILAAVESTGGYENNWLNRLISMSQILPVRVARINPAWISFNSQASGRRNKTDRISARNIAEYMIDHPEKVHWITQPDPYANLRRQWNVICLLVKQKTQLLNCFQSLLYSSLPEMVVFCRENVPQWLLRLMSLYASYDEIRHAGIEKLSLIRFVSTLKARRIITAIHNGVGSSNPGSSQMLKTLASQILQLDQTIEQQKKLLENNHQEAQAQVDLLRTFKGIGVYSAVGFILNIPDVNQFATAKKVSSFFGVHPVYKQSGDGSWGYRMSRQGRSELRSILYMVAFSGIRVNPVIKAVYAQCRAHGMKHNAAIGVCMHKVLRIVYGMLKHNKPFDPSFHQRTKRTRSAKPQEPMTDPLRRLQQFEENAPVSRRQQRKRKEQAQSQDDHIVKHGINKPAPSLHPVNRTQHTQNLPAKKINKTT